MASGVRPDIGNLDHNAFLNALRDRLRNEADTNVILAETSERLAHHFRASRTGYGEVDEAAETFFPRNHWIDGSVVSIDEPLPFAVFGERITGGLKRGEVWTHESLDDPALDDAGREICRELGIVAAITVPLMKGGRFVALLSVQHSTPHCWTAADVALVREVAERTWATLERAHAEEARSRSEAELERSREALYQAEKINALGALLAGVSHELNNPLSIIVAQAELLGMEALSPSAAARAAKISRAAQRSARIVQTFLAMARQKTPDRGRVDLNEVVRAAVELVGYGLRTGGIAVREELESGLPAILGDGDQLHQVVVNLLVNAQQAMEGWAGERVLRIATGSDASGAVFLTVADSGPGIPADIQRRIFDPFFTTKAKNSGTGIGLSFSQGIVEAHGGSLLVVEGSSGATFRIVLPAEADAGTAIEEATVEAEPIILGRHRSALVVDDEPQVAETLADMLAPLGFTVATVTGGVAAMKAIGETDFDLIVSDLRMPDVDGPALLAWIEATHPALASRTAFYTGDTLSPAAARFLEETDRPYMEKPFSLASVRRLVAALDARVAVADA